MDDADRSPPPDELPADAVAQTAAGVAADVRRVADRLRSLSQARLAAPCGGYPSAADAGRAVAQSLADAAAALEGEPIRLLPRLSDFAVGDQVAVTGHDLLAALQPGPSTGPGQPRPDPPDPDRLRSDKPGPDLAALANLAAELAAVRRLL